MAPPPAPATSNDRGTDWLNGPVRPVPTLVSRIRTGDMGAYVSPMAVRVCPETSRYSAKTLAPLRFWTQTASGTCGSTLAPTQRGRLCTLYESGEVPNVLAADTVLSASAGPCR